MIGSQAEDKHFIQELAKESSTVGITPKSIWLSFVIGKGFNQKVYLVQDTPESNETGIFIHPKIVRGTINYKKKIIDILFTDALVDKFIKPFKCSYSYRVNHAFPKGTELWANYYFTQLLVSITEAGFRSRDGTLVMYATFPPLEFTSTKYHLNFMALVKKK